MCLLSYLFTVHSCSVWGSTSHNWFLWGKRSLNRLLIRRLSTFSASNFPSTFNFTCTSNYPHWKGGNSLSRMQQCWILNTLNCSIKCLFKGFLTDWLTGQFSIYLRNILSGEKWLMCVAVWLEGSLLNMFSPVSAIPKQEFLCAGTTQSCSLAQLQSLPEVLGRELGLAPDKSFVAWNGSAPLHASPRWVFPPPKKPLSISVKKYSSICVFVAIRAIHFCDDFKVDIWISQLLYAHAKGTANHLEYTHELTKSSLIFHPIHAHFYCNLWFELKVQFSWTSLKLLNRARYSVPHLAGKKHVLLLWEW